MRIPVKIKRESQNNDVVSEVPGFTLTPIRLFVFFIICVLVGVISIFGFLLFKEYKSQEVDEGSVHAKQKESDFRSFNNDYWGFKFLYPGSWVRVTGLVKDSEFFFSSEKINFLNELSTTEYLVGVKTYNNYLHLSESDWFKEEERVYYPQGKVLGKKQEVFMGRPAQRVTFELYKAQGNVKYVDMLTISKNDATKLQILFMAADKEVADGFAGARKTILDSFVFYDGFGEEK